MASKRLISEAKSRRSRIAELKNLDIAPDNCGISCWKHQGSIYMRLVFQDEDGTQSTQYLGKANSREHYEWETKIARRDEIIALEQQLYMLEELMAQQDTWEQQQAALRWRRKEIALQGDENSPVDMLNLSALYHKNDSFKWEGKHYTITSAGRKVLLLTNEEGQPCYFKEGQVVIPQDAAETRGKQKKSTPKPLRFSLGLGFMKKRQSTETVEIT